MRPQSPSWRRDTTSVFLGAWAAPAAKWELPFNAGASAAGLEPCVSFDLAPSRDGLRLGSLDLDRPLSLEACLAAGRGDLLRSLAAASFLSLDRDLSLAVSLEPLAAFTSSPSSVLTSVAGDLLLLNEQDRHCFS